MIISAIVAVSENHVIGKQGSIPWKIREDMQLFKEKTINHWMITGRKNFESMGSRSLPDRKTMVLSNSLQLSNEIENVRLIRGVEEGIEHAKEMGESELFIIGGAQIYSLYEPYYHRIYLSRVHGVINGDVILNEFDLSHFNSSFQKTYEKNEKNEFSFTFNIYDLRSCSHDGGNGDDD